MCVCIDNAFHHNFVLLGHDLKCRTVICIETYDDFFQSMAAAAGGGYVPGMEGQAVSPSVDGAGSPADVSGGGDPGGHQNGGGGGGANYGADINQLLDQVCSLHTAPPIQF